MATTATTKPKKTAKRAKPQPERNSLSEWVVTCLLLIYGTSLIAQPFVIPTSSMHNTLLTGDHLIVDKLAYSPGGKFSSHILPYTPPKRGDIIVFRHPILLQEDYVKRVIGQPGDHIKLVHKQLWLNGHPVNEPYVIHISNNYDPYRDDFPNGGTLDYTPDPRMPGGMRGGDVTLGYEIATDPALRDIVRRGEATAEQTFAYSVHLDVRGLEPGRSYWYRFTNGDAASRIGRALIAVREISATAIGE